MKITFINLRRKVQQHDERCWAFESSMAGAGTPEAAACRRRFPLPLIGDRRPPKSTGRGGAATTRGGIPWDLVFRVPSSAEPALFRLAH